MAIIRTFDNNENNLNYVGTLSFLCAISCTIIMLRFRGFKATFHISKKKQNNLIHYDETPGVSITGAYRSNKDELFGSTDYPDPPKKITPSMVSLPAAQSGHRKDISKSTSNLAQPLNENVIKTQSTPNIPEAVPEPLTKTEIKEQKKIEKKNLDEQKKIEKKHLDEQKKIEKKHLDEQKKQAKLAKEQEKAEQLRKEREKGEQLRKEREKGEQLRKDREKEEQLRKEREKGEQLRKEREKGEQLRKDREKEEQLRKDREKGEQLRKEREKEEQLRKEREKGEQLRKEREKGEQLRKEREKQIQKTKAEEKTKSKRKAPQPQPQPENVQVMPEIAARSKIPESTNTLESSISRSSGPPPYSPKEEVTIASKSDPSDNITFSDNSSWEMISQHRQQINRPVVVKSLPKQTRLDLQYKVNTDNSDA